MLRLYISASETIRRYLVRDQRGVTAIEYALIAAVIVVGLTVAGGGLSRVGTELNSIFGRIADELANRPGGTP